MKLTRRQALASGAAVLATTIAKPAIAAKDPIPVGYLPALTGPSTACAVIMKRVDERTRSMTSINELLRD